MILWISFPALVGQKDGCLHSYRECCLDTSIRQYCTWNSSGIWGQWFVLFTGKAMSCTLCSYATISIAVGWSMQLPCAVIPFLGQVSWSSCSTVDRDMSFFLCLAPVCKDPDISCWGFNSTWPMSPTQTGTLAFPVEDHFCLLYYFLLELHVAKQLLSMLASHETELPCWTGVGWVAGPSKL